MNRRSYLKSIISLSVTGVAAFSIFKGYELYKPVNTKALLSKRNVIAELVDLIIPATDTPGAKEAMVHDYLLTVLINCNSIKQQNRFLSGIEDLEQYALDHYNRDFLHCGIVEKNLILEHFSENFLYAHPLLNKIDNKILGEPFFSKLRNLTVEGYCQSQLGATQGLAYDYIPQTFEACIPLKPHQKSWATK